MPHTVLLFALLTGNLVAEDLEKLLRWHRSTREAIHSISCDLGVVWTYPEQPTQQPESRSGSYRRQGELVKVTENVGFEATSRLHRGGKCVAMSRTPSSVGMSISSIKDCISFFHIERFAGLIVTYPMALEYYPLEELVRQARRTPRVRERGELVDLELQLPDRDREGVVWTTTVTLDKSLGCMIVQVVDECSHSKPYQRIRRMSDFEEFPDGVHFPRRLEGRSVVEGKVQTVMTTRITNLKINETIPAREFALDIPHGVWVFDNLRMTKYQIDAQGNRISEEMPYQKVTTVMTTEEKARVRTGPNAPTVEEPTGFWPFAWYGSALVMVVLVLAWVCQRARA
ncbi:MAG TPA: hypothetical protein PKD86_03985 [Gemmatales bacterium]|nr:hypothetical protein [Gemmatales bacterium]HMP58493.1 hypothetical protein [Gemmatales bacterium]